MFSKLMYGNVNALLWSWRCVKTHGNLKALFLWVGWIEALAILSNIRQEHILLIACVQWTSFREKRATENAQQRWSRDAGV